MGNSFIYERPEHGCHEDLVPKSLEDKECGKNLKLCKPASLCLFMLKKVNYQTSKCAAFTTFVQFFLL
jgi:hypothetical protein